MLMKYRAGYYIPTNNFRNISEHAAVMDAQTKGLVAVTGPADDVPSLAVAQLFAAAPELLITLQETVNLLKSYRDGLETDATEIGCNAGNWDGGSASNCEHCRLKRAIEEINSIIDRAVAAIVYAMETELELNALSFLR